jgi:hypothetical protein
MRLISGVFALAILLSASDGRAQGEAQQTASLSTCRVICAKSSGVLDDSEKALLRQNGTFREIASRVY